MLHTSPLALLASAASLEIPFIGDWSSSPLYLGAAVLGGAVLSLQTLLLLFGGDGGDGELDSDHGSDAFGFLSIRAVASFFTFFGLMGLYGKDAGWGAGLTAGAATGAGAAMMVLVAWLFSLHRNLSQEGTLDPSQAVGKPAKVYLRIPAERSGRGKITVALQGRTAEFPAVTSGPELASGSEARVVRQLDENLFEVEAAS